MRNLLALVGALVVVFAGLGWYLGWYKLSVSKTADGNLRVQTEVDTNKIVADSEDKLKRAGAYLGNQLDKAGQDAKAGPPPTPGVTPGPATADQNQKVSVFGFDLTPSQK